MIFVATERVTPLAWDTKRGVLNTDVLRWGLYTVAVRTLLNMRDGEGNSRGQSSSYMRVRRVCMGTYACRVFILLKPGNGKSLDWKS